MPTSCSKKLRARRSRWNRSPFAPAKRSGRDWLKRPARGRRGGRRRLLCGRAGPCQVILDEEEVVGRPLHDRKHRRHAGDLLALLLEEPVQELLADEVSLLSRDPGNRGDV